MNISWSFEVPLKSAENEWLGGLDGIISWLVFGASLTFILVIVLWRLTRV